MNITARTEYACRALLELALNWPNVTPVQIYTIAENQQIPMKFLTHILIQLKQQGYVESVRGKNGGYTLLKNPREVIVGDIVKAFSDFKFKVTASRGRGKKISAKIDVLGSIWQEMDQVISDFLNNITLENIVVRYRSGEKVPMYTI